MGIRKRLEEREHQRAKETRIVKHHLKTMEDTLTEAKEQHLPTIPFIESTLALMKYMLKNRGYP